MTPRRTSLLGQVGLLAVALLLSVTRVTMAQPNLPYAAGMLPPDAEIAIAADLGAFSNPKSLLSLVPKSEMEKMLDEEQARQSRGKGTDAATAAEAALRIAFDKANSGRFHSFAAGIVSGTDANGAPSIQKDYAVLVGKFQAAEILTALKTFGVVPWSAGKPGLFPSPSNAQVYINSPQENVLVLSSDSTWVAGAAALQKNASGLMAKSSDFASSVSSMGGRSPDALVFIKGALGQRLVAADPMAGMLLGPFTKAKGTVLSLHAADIPTLELHSAFENEQMAGFAQTFLQQAILLGKAQVQGAIKDTANAEELKQLNSTLEMIGKLQPEVVGSSAVLRLPISQRPDKAEFQRQFLDSFRSALQGDLEVPEGLPIGM